MARSQTEPLISPTGLGAEVETWLSVIDEMPVGVTVVEPGSEFPWHNKAARRILGLGEAPAWPPPAEPATYGAVHADGRPYALEDYPLTRVLQGGGSVERELMRYRRADGQVLMLEISASKVRPHGRQLGFCTYQDVTAEHAARRELAETAERVQLALDAGAILGTWVWNVAENVMTTDELFAHFFGLDPERCRNGLPPSEAMVSVHPDDHPGVEAAVAEAIARGGAYRHQYRVLQPDGNWRWVEGSGRVELDEAGRPLRFPGVLLDISAWKQAEEARDLLTREVDHRARNALAMVQSVVRLTDAQDPARFREEVVGRVDAMARAQGTLSRSNWEGGVLGELVEGELSTYAAAPRFALHGPKLALPAAQVQAISMIMHEMATNAVKHGALSTPDGKVEVAWHADRRRNVELTWTESGGPALQPPKRQGFGSRLIARLAAQLGGALDLDWRPEGLVARLVWRA
ncbi:PAS domain-containing protein [Phenylobacterium sp. LjRoot219]|uniref:sensor histidine kinase n=1 Tax=Phenylobacterium sp. LjRoot219 TaxID=3342283 RepID=UPI003ECDA27B